MLLEDTPENTIDRIAEAWGLSPPAASLPPSSPSTLAVRVIAGLLERRALGAVTWRTTAGVAGWNMGSLLASWATDTFAPSDRRDEERLSQLVIVHRAPQEATIREQIEIEGMAWLIDIDASTASLCDARRSGAALDLPDMYRRCSRVLSGVISELDALMIE